MPNLRTVLPKPKDLEPSEDYILWRYTDIPSLMEILAFEYLPLVKMSCLSDKAEGAYLKSILSKIPVANEYGLDLVFDISKAMTFVSCWCKNSEELAPMWERFSPPNGVAIKTTAKRLLECLSLGQEYDIKFVEYIKHSPDDVLSKFDQIGGEEWSELKSELKSDLHFYKMSDFRDEKEVRILRSDNEHLWNLITIPRRGVHSMREHVYKTYVSTDDILPVDIDSMTEFITQIVISPAARSGIFKIVKNLLKTHDEKRVSEGKPKLEIDVVESRRKKWF